MNRRRLAGYALLSVIPVTFVTLAALAGQLLELAVGAGIAVVCSAALIGGLNLLDNNKRGKS